MRLNPELKTISGTVFADLNRNGINDDGAAVPEGSTVYLDLDGPNGELPNGILDEGEPTATTFGSAGYFSFGNVEPERSYVVAQQVQDGWTETLGPQVVNVTDSDVGGVELGAYVPTVTTTYSENEGTTIRDGGRAYEFWMDIPDAAQVLDVNVQVDITGGSISDLDVWLVREDGDSVSYYGYDETATVVTLISEGQVTGTALAGTIFDDEAETSILDGSSPFDGTYQPLSLATGGLPLGAFDHDDMQGRWKLFVRDDGKNRIKHVLNSWSLDVTHVAPGPVNLPPTADPDSAATVEDASVVIDKLTLLSNDSDPESDPISITGFGTPGNGTLVDNSATVTYTPDADFNGTDTFTYTISDGNGGTDTGTVTVNVTPLADPPVAEDDTASTVMDNPVTIDMAELLLNDSDPDGDVLTITSVDAPANGTVVIDLDGDSETITFTPTEDFVGVGSFTYTITDGNGSTATATVTVDILAAGAERVYTSVDGPLNIGDLKTVTSTVLATFDDPVNTANVAIDFTHAAPETLVISLFSPDGGDSLTLVPSGTAGLYGVVIPEGMTHTGTWTLQIYDTLKDRQRGTLYGWTLTINPANPAPLAAATTSATDLALLSMFDLDPTDDDDTDPWTDSLVDDLALMLV
ncbi:MAG: cadherin-like domain-containing protein [Planctomycetes bacterium]|nr:cadherin-like domain-containing protein [Planctomycetota bacterium]